MLWVSEFTTQFKYCPDFQTSFPVTGNVNIKSYNGLIKALAYILSRGNVLPIDCLTKYNKIKVINVCLTSWNSPSKCPFIFSSLCSWLLCCYHLLQRPLRWICSLSVCYFISTCVKKLLWARAWCENLVSKVTGRLVLLCSCRDVSQQCL